MSHPPLSLSLLSFLFVYTYSVYINYFSRPNDETESRQLSLCILFLPC